MDRRRFLSLSATSIAITACGSGSNYTSSTPSTPTPTPTIVSSNIAESNWQQLADKLMGNLIRPSNVNDYERARLVFNTRFDHVYPQAIVFCENDSDVISALTFVQEHNMHVTSRCGGHGYAGYSTTEGLVIDVTPMNSIILGNGEVTIGAGARLVDVYDQLTAQGVCIPLGSCLSVGISGLTLGGGIGVVDRAYGLTCDNLISAEIITAQGNKLQCNNTDNSDLFWALRGGGGGNFGVVTSFTFKTHVTSDITVFEAYFSFDDFEEVMAQWQTLAQYWPNEMWGQIIPNWISSNTPVLQVRAFCLNSQSEATPYWEEFINSINTAAQPTKITTDSYRNIMLGNCSDSIAACHISSQFTEGQMQRSAFAASSDYFNVIVPPIGITTLKNFITDSIANNDRGMIIINTMAGAINNINPNDTAFPHRMAIISTEYYTYLPISSSAEQIDKAQAWENSFREVMKPWSSGGAYVNYIDPLIEDWQYAYYGDNYARLRDIKFKYDPVHLFQIPQGIEPT
jgi:FAD/FMN-containing dehydrogenase